MQFAAQFKDQASAQITALDQKLRALNRTLKQTSMPQAMGNGLFSADGYRNAARRVSDFRSEFIALNKSMGTFDTVTNNISRSVDTLNSRLDGGKVSLKEAKQALRDREKLFREQVQLQQSMTYTFGTNSRGETQAVSLLPRSINSDIRKVTDLNTRLATTGKVYERLGEEMIKAGKNAQWSGRQMMLGITLPLAMASAAAAKFGFDMDKAITRVTKVYGDIGGQFEETTESVRQNALNLVQSMTKMYGQSSRDTLEIMGALAAAGKTGNELSQTAAITSRASMLGELDRQDAIKATIQMQAVYGYSLDELAEKYNYINALENQTSLEAQDFIKAIPRAAGVFKTMGASIEDMGTLMTAFKAAGIDAEEGANALKSINFRAVAAYGKGVESFNKATGASYEQMVELTNGNGVQMLEKLALTMDKLAPAERVRVTRDLFGIYQGSKALMLMEQLVQKSGQLKQAQEVAGYSAAQNAAIAQREIDTMMERPYMRFQKAIMDLQNTVSEIGQGLIGPFTFALEKLESMVEKINDMPIGIKAIGGALAAALAGIGPLLMLAGLFQNIRGQVYRKGGQIAQMFAGHGPNGRAFETAEKMQQKAIDNNLDLKVADASRRAMVDQTTAIQMLTKTIEVFNQQMRQHSSTLPGGGKPEDYAYYKNRVRKVDGEWQGDWVAKPFAERDSRGKVIKPKYEQRDLASGRVGFFMAGTNEKISKTMWNEEQARIAVLRAEHERLAAISKERLTFEQALNQQLLGEAVATEEIAQSEQRAATASKARRWNNMAAKASMAGGMAMMLGTGDNAFMGGLGTGLMTYGMAAQFIDIDKIVGNVRGTFMNIGSVVRHNILRPMGDTLKISDGVKNKFGEAGSKFSGMMGRGLGFVTKFAGQFAIAGVAIGLIVTKLQEAGKIAARQQEAYINSAKTWSEILQFAYVETPEFNPTAGAPKPELAIRSLRDKFLEQDPDAATAINKDFHARGASDGDAYAIALAEAIKAKVHGASIDAASDAGASIAVMLNDELSADAIKIRIQAVLEDDGELFKSQIQEQIDRIRGLQGESALKDRSFWQDFTDLGVADLTDAQAKAATEAGKQWVSAFMQGNAEQKQDAIKMLDDLINEQVDYYYNKIDKEKWSNASRDNVRDVLLGLGDNAKTYSVQHMLGDDETFAHTADGFRNVAAAIGEMNPQVKEAVAAGKDLVPILNDQLKKGIQNRTIKLSESQAVEGYTKMIARLEEQQRGVAAAYEKSGEARQEDANGVKSILTETEKLSALNFWRDAMGLGQVTNLKYGFKEAANEIEEAAIATKNLEQQLQALGSLYSYEDVLGVYKDTMSSGMQNIYGEMERLAQEGDNRRKEAMQAAAQREQEGFQKRIEASDKAFDKAKERQDAAQKAASRAFESRQTREQRAFEKSQKAQMDALDKKIEAEKKAEELRQKMFEAEMTRIRRLADINNQRIDFNVALQEGNLDEAAKISNTMQATQEQWLFDDAGEVAKDASQQRIDDLGKKKEALRERQQIEKDAFNERQKLRKQEFQDEQDKAKKTLDMQKSAARERLQAEKDTNNKIWQNRQKSLEKEIESHRRARARDIEIIRATIPKDEAEANRQVETVAAVYKKYGDTVVVPMGKSWNSTVATELQRSFEIARNKASDTKAWENVGDKVANAVAMGAFGFGADAMMSWLAGGPMPSRKGGKQTKAGLAGDGKRLSKTQAVIRHDGGIIPRGGNSGGYDTSGGLHQSEVMVRALTGEGVVNRIGMSRLGEKGLNALNSGMGGGGTGPMGVNAFGLLAAAAASRSVIEQTINAIEARTANQGLAGMIGTAAAAAGLSGNSNAQKAFNYLISNGFTPQAASGVIGNLMQESQVNPRAIQPNGPGRGIMQWTEGARWADYKRWAGKRDIWSLATQLEWMMKEMRDYGVLSQIRSMKSVQDATLYFERTMEKAGVPNMPARYRYAQAAFSALTKPGMIKGAPATDYSGFGSQIDLSNVLGSGLFGNIPASSSGNGLSWGAGGSGSAFRGQWMRPLAGAPMTSAYGPRNLLGMSFHNGMDYGAPSGTPIKSAAGGRVIYAGYSNKGYGNWTLIQAPDGTVFGYGHQSSFGVRSGQQVNAGQIIGRVGSTGNSTGPHLHFMTGKGGQWFNPRSVLPGLKTGGHTLSDGLAMLHRNETVLTSDLSDKLKTGVDIISRGGGGDTYQITVDLTGSVIRDNVDIESAVYAAMDKIESRRGRNRKIT